MIALVFRKKDTIKEIVHLKTGKGYAFTFCYYLIIYFSLIDFEEEKKLIDFEEEKKLIDFVIGKWRQSLNACSQNMIYH